MNKIQPNHLERGAYVYVRQSTMEQVQHNLESQHLQYRLKERGKELGWNKVVCIDEDLGCSASGDVERFGFERLLSEVCQGTVGAILAFDASRLARNGREWHTLLEMCAIVDTLLIDPESIYDPKLPNDRLLLGMKGTLSELEMSLFRGRCQAAIREKAKRGEYYNNLPVGYRKDGKGITKEPDERVQESLRLIFAKFTELGSVRQATMWFRQSDIQVPVIAHGSEGRKIQWKIPGAETLLHVLRNPTYAGAYVYGRRKKRVVLEGGKKRVRTEFRRDSQDWDVLLPDHHEGYITWEDYQANQKTISNNANMMGERVQGAAKGGSSLLTGILRCGHCGRKLSVSYEGSNGQYIRYNCKNNMSNLDGERCISFTARGVEESIAEAVLETISPLGVEAALEAAKTLARQSDELLNQYRLHLEQARYECQRAQRQYDAVEPENRVVARQLEARWNQALERVSELEKEFEMAASSIEMPLTEKDRRELIALGENLPAVWSSEPSSPQLKKRIVRTVLKEVVVYLEERLIRLILHWEGGEHTERTLRRLTPAQAKCHTDVDTVDAIRKLSRIMPDGRIAQVLNRLGKKTARGLSWNLARVRVIRHHNEIQVYQDGEQHTRGELNLSEAAEFLEIHPRIVKKLIAAGHLPATQACFGAPWTICKSDLGRESLQVAIKTIASNVPQTVSPNQGSLNF